MIVKSTGVQETEYRRIGLLYIENDFNGDGEVAASITEMDEAPVEWKCNKFRLVEISFAHFVQ